MKCVLYVQPVNNNSVPVKRTDVRPHLTHIISCVSFLSAHLHQTSWSRIRGALSPCPLYSFMTWYLGREATLGKHL
jgi:hypothetical protein